MELAKIKACICEGAAEAAIMDVLLDNNLLIFKREDICSYFLKTQVQDVKNKKHLLNGRNYHDKNKKAGNYVVQGKI